ncbi:MAG TPA: uroporphyrinogen decarboxylase [Planctomycetota bacterium]|jgi:uroporphyrinogen decarboxylase|nr:uroporphyrinogen decarboxylase [Planctomycetota bacterium]
MAVSAASGTARLLRAARRERADRTPVWFMRQAGRYLPEYRAIRERLSLLEICARPEVAAEVTLQPVRRLGVDGAILFADLLLPLVPMGLRLEFAEGEGPVIHNPVRTAEAVDRLAAVDARDALGSVLETVRLVRRELDPSLPLLGFAGAPFTLACYAVEGGGSRDFLETKRMMLAAPQAFDSLLRRLTAVVEEYLAGQVEAGADALQVFDTWAGALSPADYRRYVLPHSRRLFERLAALPVPTIHFGVGTATLLEAMAEAGGDVIGLDWRVPLDEGWARVGEGRAVQGNLDPAALFAPRPELEARVRDVLRRAGGRAGHIFNLGHGIPPGTPVDSVRAVVDLVHALTG